MEFNNCEEYVLAKLESAQEEVLALKDEVERLEAENQLLVERIEAKASGVERIIADAGRSSLFDRCTNVCRIVKNGDDVTQFKDWCLDCIYSSCIPKGLSKTQFIEAFEPEFLEAYNERLAVEAEE